MLLRALSPPERLQPALAGTDGVRPRDPGSRDAGALPADTVSLGPWARRQDGRPVKPGTGGLTDAEAALVTELQARDREVRSHEAAHQAAGGSLAGGASFSYQQGPDGRSYAVGGEVPIDLSAGRTPEETIQKARQIRAAALAPADPSGQDLRVAAEASALEAQAQLQLVMERQLAGREALQKRPDHLHAGEPCLTCQQHARSYGQPAAAVTTP